MSANTIKLKPYTMAELSKLYDVCSRTFKKWVDPFHAEIGKKIGRYYTINQVRVIFDKLGLPKDISPE